VVLRLFTAGPAQRTTPAPGTLTGMWIRYGEVGAPAAVVLPGSGSTAEFVARAFAAPLAAAGHALVTADPPPSRPGVTDPAEAWGLALDALAGEPLALVGGVSLGAHAAARWAARRPGAAGGLLLVMPAWTGPPDAVAAVSGATADEVDGLGVEAVLARLRDLATHTTEAAWVVDELHTAWRRRGRAALVAELHGVAASPGPDLGELRRIAVPCGVVALAGDPLHPASVAADRAARLPAAGLVTVDHPAVAADRATLGSAALRALTAATVPTGSAATGAR
jgi:pimeloyl-ACP methyl ester carboxylesterase